MSLFQTDEKHYRCQNCGDNNPANFYASKSRKRCKGCIKKANQIGSQALKDIVHIVAEQPINNQMFAPQANMQQAVISAQFIAPLSEMSQQPDFRDLVASHQISQEKSVKNYVSVEKFEEFVKEIEDQEITDRLDSHVDQMQNMTADIRNVKGYINAVGEKTLGEYDKMMTVMKEVIRRYEDLAEKNKTIDEKLVRLQEENVELKAKVSDLEKRHQVLNGQALNIRDFISDLNESYDLVVDDIKSLKNELSEKPKEF
jgi:hypothetical protein